MPEDSADAWVRVRITKDVTLADGTAGNTDYILIDTEDGWTAGEDGWYYYEKPMTSGDITTPLFEEVQFSQAMDNTHQRATANITITAQAVQTAHNGATVMEAAGWPSEEE